MRLPLHPLLARFPFVCWLLASAADLASLRWGEPAWHLAGTLLWIGIVLALPALFAGLFALIRVPDEPAANRLAWLHMVAMTTALVLYVISLLLRVHEAHIIAPGPGALGTSLGGALVLGIGGWLGARMVYEHGIGTALRERSSDD